MIPQSVEDILNENFFISACMDNAELEAWLAMLPAALQRLLRVTVEKKRNMLDAVDKYALTEAREYVQLDEGINVTTKKMMVKTKENVIADSQTKRETTIAYDAAEALMKGIVEKSQSIRKIATIRANTQQFSETDYVVKRQERIQQPVQQSPVQQPDFGQPNNSFQQSQSNPNWQQQQQQPQGNSSNFFPPNDQPPVPPPNNF